MSKTVVAVDRRFRKAADMLIDDVSPDSLYPRLGAAASALCASDIVGLNSFSLDGKFLGIDYVTPAESTPDSALESFSTVVYGHPAYAHAVKDGRVVRLFDTPTSLSDFVSMRQLRDLAFWSHFLKPIGMTRQLLVTLMLPHCGIVLTLNRKGSDFTTSERTRLHAFRPLLQHAADAAASIGDYQRRLTHGDGVAALDRRLGLVACDARAEALLARYGEQLSKRDGLAKQIGAWVFAISRLTTLAMQSLGERVFESDRIALRVRAYVRPDATSALLLLQEVRRPSAARFGLTRREGEIMHYLAQGKANREIGEVFDIEERTVEAHVRNILRKLGVSNRGAAIATWWTL